MRCCCCSLFAACWLLFDVLFVVGCLLVVVC